MDKIQEMIKTLWWSEAPDRFSIPILVSSSIIPVTLLILINWACAQSLQIEGTI